MDNLPKFVKLNNTAMRLVGDRYYRDGGNWYVDYKVIEEDLASWSWGRGLPHLHRRLLTEVTEKEWRECNGKYAPNISQEISTYTECPQCNNQTVDLAFGGGVVCTNDECDYWFCY